MYRKLVTTYASGCIMLLRKNGNGVEFLGTAFLVHEKGYFLTCAHTFQLDMDLAVAQTQPINEWNSMTQEKVNVIDVSVAQYDSVHDCALLKSKEDVPASVLRNMFTDPNKSPVGASVLYFGYPFGDMGLHTLKVSSSIISSKAIDGNGTKQFQLDSMVHDGNSGGPLIDVKMGQVIGMISGKFNPSGNTGGVTIGNYALGSESSISYDFIRSEIPSYQRESVLEALALTAGEQVEFDNLGMLLTGERRQMSFVSPVGARGAKPSSGFWENIKKEVHDYFCTKSKKYAQERKRAEITFKEIVTILATAIAAQFSVAYGLIAGAVSVAVLSVCKIGRNAWCKTYSQ